MEWIIVLGVIAALAILPVGIGLLYDTDGARVWLTIGPVRYLLFPGKKKKSSPKEKKSPQKARTAVTSKKQTDKKNGGSLKEFVPLVYMVLDFLVDFRNKLRVSRLELKLILAGDDPCDLAVNYGKAWAALGNLMPHLERYFVIKKRDLEVECDFNSDKTLVFARLDISVTVGRLLGILLCHGVRIMREYLRIKNISEGGAES